MTKALTKVIYKPAHTANDEYTVIVNPEEGHQGLLGKPSKQQLDTDFGSHKDTDVVTIILEKGKELASDSVGSLGSASTNIARGPLDARTGNASRRGI
ncbi:hypothetical protein C0991_007842 [Blastosporella zonata]|nr:hypothetical protein C0991_007842 [Blastosporella zonata]